MGKYSLIDNEEADSRIGQILDHIVREICEAVNPISVILAGSFGRGEGTVTFENGKVDILSDFEICVVSPDVRCRAKCEKLSKKLSQDLCAEITVAWMSPERVSCNKNSNATFGRNYPSIFMYELKAGSKVLYGRDVLTYNVIDPKKLPLWEGIKLLFNRMAESLSDIFAAEARLYREKWMNKTLLACGDILLLDNKLYHHSYNERKQRLADSVDFANYPFLDMRQREHLINAYENKLCGEYDVYRSASFAEFNKTVDSTLRLFLKKEMNVSFALYDECSDAYLSITRNFYKCYTYKLRWLVHPLYENMIYLFRLIQRGRIPNIRVLSKINIPWHHLIYSIVPPLYFFELLSERERENISNYTNKIIVMFNERPSTDIEVMKRTVLRLWFNICCGKKV
jgi:hypothetical protein